MAQKKEECISKTPLKHDKEGSPNVLSSLKNIALEQDRDQWIFEIKNYKKDKILPKDDKR